MESEALKLLWRFMVSVNYFKLKSGTRDSLGELLTNNKK